MRNVGQIIQVKAQRTFLSNIFVASNEFMKSEEVSVGIVVKEENKLFSLEICEGGVTGYESFFLNSRSLQNVAYRDWHACMGTTGRWDRLVVPWSSMKQVYDYFELWGMMNLPQGKEQLIEGDSDK